MIVSTVHPLEWTFFLFSTFSLGLWSAIIYLKWRDFRLNLQNGVVKFMLTDNLRFGAVLFIVVLFSFFMSLICLVAAPTYGDYDHLPQSYALLVNGNFMILGLTVIGFLRLRRRREMAKLIAKYGGLPGGRRGSDPPQGIEL